MQRVTVTCAVYEQKQLERIEAESVEEFAVNGEKVKFQFCS